MKHFYLAFLLFSLSTVFNAHADTIDPLSKAGNLRKMIAEEGESIARRDANQASNARDDCDEDSMMRSEIMCVSEKQFKVAYNDMHKSYMALLKSATTEDGKNHLIFSQQAWLIFRDSACDYETVSWAGGREQAVSDDMCKIGMIDERTKQLNAYIACNGDDCAAIQ